VVVDRNVVVHERADGRGKIWCERRKEGVKRMKKQGKKQRKYKGNKKE
jgi:hypothetical protein